jgi:hypothetical protein
MPRYSFTIIQGGQLRPSNSFDCKDDGAAKKEAAGTFADMSRGISERLELDDSDWQIEVADEAGKSIFKIKVAAESKKGRLNWRPLYHPANFRTPRTCRFVLEWEAGNSGTGPFHPELNRVSWILF